MMNLRYKIHHPPLINLSLLLEKNRNELNCCSVAVSAKHFNVLVFVGWQAGCSEFIDIVNVIVIVVAIVSGD